MRSGLTHLMSMPWLSSSSSMKSSLLITSFPVLVLQPFFFQPWTQLVIPREHTLTLIHQEGLASPGPSSLLTVAPLIPSQSLDGSLP